MIRVLMPKCFNQEFDTFYKDNGIKHERTSPYSPQQNGLAERKNRTLCVMRSKLGAQSMKSVFIGYAQNNKAYRLLDDKSGVVVESRDVEIFNYKFSRDDEKSNNTTSTSTSRETIPPPSFVEEPREGTRTRIKKSFGDDFYSYLVKGTQKKLKGEVIFSINMDDDPKTFTEAMMSRDAPLWKEAINDERDSILGNRTWEFADLPKGRRPIGSKWIFNKKYHRDESISAYKARLVAKGSRKQEGIDYFDTYTPIARISSIRTLIAISDLKGLYIHQLDVKTTFLNGYLKEEIYLEQPEGFAIPRPENKSEKDRKSDTSFYSSVKPNVNSGRVVAQLEYASAIGRMMYATYCTRPDIAFVKQIESVYCQSRDGALEGSG
uniref:Integrase catalytic domain-containing protein n=1 Tax=Lactuca sativa TaxID=4236 RepID=A0A9R1WT85_LACSA|nr:hypothetical protein LSAT_V11C900494230 [Lactuca sativa]